MSATAYFITFHCYGTWLHGDAPGSVDPQHNVPGTPFVPPDADARAFHQGRMDQPCYSLDQPRRLLVLRAIVEVCRHRHWNLLAAHVRTTHVHLVVQAEAAPERVMNDCKSYASRALNAAGLDQSERKRWSRHGSTRYLHRPEQLAAVVHYVLHEQGEPMERFKANPPEGEPRPSGCAGGNAP
jgi:REP element-mobilizing transposase RayT